MGIRQHAAVLLALLVPTMAGAHEHNRAMFLGVSGRTGGSMLWGVHGSYEEVLFKGKHSDHSVCNPRHWSAVLDASAHFRSHDGFAITGGLSYTIFGSCPKPGKYPQFLPTVYALPIGKQKTGTLTDDSWRWVGVLGAQLDLLVRREDGIRAQVDVIQNYGGDHATNVRFSIGLLLRFFNH